MARLEIGAPRCSPPFTSGVLESRRRAVRRRGTPKARDGQERPLGRRERGRWLGNEAPRPAPAGPSETARRGPAARVLRGGRRVARRGEACAASRTRARRAQGRRLEPGVAGRAAIQEVATRSSTRTGRRRTRLPVAAKIALHTAGAMTGTPGSPTPVGG